MSWVSLKSDNALGSMMQYCIYCVERINIASFGTNYVSKAYHQIPHAAFEKHAMKTVSFS